MNLETRTHNLFNEITSIDSNSLAVLHDRAGNMTRFTSALTNATPVLATWDAWNRLTRLADTSGATIAVYSYDGDWKRLKKTLADGSRKDYFYDDMQLAEVRTNGVASEQFVYDTRYLHSVALRDRDTDGDGDCTDSGGSERLFYCNDANFNVTALVATNGAVVERYTYDPYGKVTIRDANWQPITWDDSQKNLCLYTGHKYDAESGLYYSIYRYYHAGLGRWATRDPLLDVCDSLVLRGVSSRTHLSFYDVGAVHPVCGQRSEGTFNNDTILRKCANNWWFGENSPISHSDGLGLASTWGVAKDTSATPADAYMNDGQVSFEMRIRYKIPGGLPNDAMQLWQVNEPITASGFKKDNCVECNGNSGWIMDIWNLWGAGVPAPAAVIGDKIGFGFGGLAVNNPVYQMAQQMKGDYCMFFYTVGRRIGLNPRGTTESVGAQGMLTGWSPALDTAHAQLVGLRQPRSWFVLSYFYFNYENCCNGCVNNGLLISPLDSLLPPVFSGKNYVEAFSILEGPSGGFEYRRHFTKTSLYSVTSDPGVWYEATSGSAVFP